MRLLLAACLASVVPLFGPRGCASSELPPMRVNGAALVLASGTDAMRAYCLAPGEDIDTVRVPEDTFPVRAGTEVWVDGPCALVVYRQDGALWARSGVDLVERGMDEVVVRLPASPIGGLGFRFEPEADGVRVVRVFAGMAAEGQLRVGDRIVAIDGHPTAGMSSGAFVERGTGPVGSRALLDVVGPEGVRRLSLDRRWLSGAASEAIGP
jgi:hypothetical protein